MRTAFEDNTACLAEELFNRYGKRMYSIAMKILKDPHDSEDALMEAFRRIIKNTDKFKELSSRDADALASVYVKNAAIDIYNSNKRRSSVIDTENLPEPSGNDPFESNAVSSALDALPYQQASVILLKYHYGYSTSEIASALGIAPFTVRKRLERAKKQLKTILIKEGIDV